MFENLKIIEAPKEAWVDRLRRNNYFYLVKENQFATVEWEYEGDFPKSGRLGFRRFDGGQWKNESWLININGTGMNGTQLFLPVEGHLPEKTVDDSLDVKQLRRRIIALEERLEALEVDICDIRYGEGIPSKGVYGATGPGGYYPNLFGAVVGATGPISTGPASNGYVYVASGAELVPTNINYADDEEDK